MKTKDTTTTKKDLGKLIVPAGKNYEEGSPAEESAESADEEAAEGDEKPAESESETEGSTETKAETLYNECEEAGDDVCKAVYEMLQEKYDAEEESTKKTAAKGGKSDTADEYDMKGME